MVVRLTGDESATRVAAKFMSAIVAVQILTRQRVQVLESDHPISFERKPVRPSSRNHKAGPKQRPPVSNSDQCLGDEITLTQALSPAASNSAKRSASF